MRKAILMVLLAVVSNSAAAAWVEIGLDDDGTTTAYANPTTISKAGNRVKMLVLLERKTAKTTAAGEPYRSSKMQNEYDCKKERWRTLYDSWYSGKKGRGAVVYSTSESSNWRPVSPTSGADLLWRFACGEP
jgi:hypothetical protein